MGISKKTTVRSGPVRRICRLVWLAVGLGLFSTSAVRANSHRLQPFFNPEDWIIAVQVEGREAKFFQEGPANGGYAILYTAPEKVKITLTAEYVGPLPPGVFPVGAQLQVEKYSYKPRPWVVAGNTATLELDMRTETNALNAITRSPASWSFPRVIPPFPRPALSTGC